MKKLFILVVLLVAGDGKEVRGVDPVEKVKSLSDSHAEDTYWWLKKPGVFGGRNYNFAQIFNGEHIRSNTSDPPASNLVKRQAEIEPEDIVSECPIGTICTQKFFCKIRKSKRELDLIPCYFPADNTFGVCCSNPEPRICPQVRATPPRENCKFARDACDRPGVKDVCMNSQLCCFNGCVNVCLKMSYFEPEGPVWRRGEWGPIRRPSKKAERRGEEEEESEVQSMRSRTASNNNREMTTEGSFKEQERRHEKKLSKIRQEKLSSIQDEHEIDRLWRTILDRLQEIR